MCLFGRNFARLKALIPVICYVPVRLAKAFFIRHIYLNRRRADNLREVSQIIGSFLFNVDGYACTL